MLESNKIKTTGKTLYFECNMGAAGDMITATLLDLHENPAGFAERFNRIGLDGIKMTVETAQKCGITGKHVHIFVNGEEEGAHEHEIHSEQEIHSGHSAHEHSHEYHHDHGHTHSHDHEIHSKHENHSEHSAHEHTHGHIHTHHHYSLNDIRTIIENLSVSDFVKENALHIYRLIAAAESKVHGRTVEEIHFHEVGALDAVADVCAACMLIEELSPAHIIASPVNTGSGFVHCAHGILPVPAPATAELLKNAVCYSSGIQGELCTPTGAAIITHFAEKFVSLPPFKIEKTGIGIGTKDFGVANVLRAFWGTEISIQQQNENQENSNNIEENEIFEFQCNIDDMTGEEIAFASEMIFDAGAVEVFTVPAGMKKGRPGILLTCLCKSENKEKVRDAIFRHTTTLGIRFCKKERFTLERRQIAVKNGELKESSGFGCKKSKIEYDDAAEFARKNGTTLREAREIMAKETSKN